MAARFGDWLKAGPKLLAFDGHAVPSNAASLVSAGRTAGFPIERYVPDSVDYSVGLPEKTTTVAFNEMYFEGWMASVGGGPSVAMHAVAGGLRALAVGTGRHRIHTWFSPRSFWLGAAASLCGVLLLMACFAWPARARRGSLRAARPDANSPDSGRDAVAAASAPAHESAEPYCS